MKGLKIAVTGKGGVGKTTVAAALAQVFAERGMTVIAVDADPDANLAMALGLPPRQAAMITPISQLKELIGERTGAEPGAMGGFFSINPKVDDIPTHYYQDIGGVKLMVLGVVEAGAGCICPESAFLRRLTQHLVLERDEVIILDMEAGIEHLGRATAGGVDVLLVVVEPGMRSIGTAATITKLAKGIGIPLTQVVVNKVSSPDQLDTLVGLLEDAQIVANVFDHPELRQADLSGKPSLQSSPAFATEIEQLADKLTGLRTDGERGEGRG